MVMVEEKLEQLGINPQGISLDNRLALIKSANDPPALLNLVRTLGVLNQAEASTQISALNANNLSNPAATGPSCCSRCAAISPIVASRQTGTPSTRCRTMRWW